MVVIVATAVRTVAATVSMSTKTEVFENFLAFRIPCIVTHKRCTVLVESGRKGKLGSFWVIIAVVVVLFAPSTAVFEVNGTGIPF